MSARLLRLALGAALFLSIDATLAGAQGSGEELLKARCASCHERSPEGAYSRISAVRKTPEGWDMTLVRMMIAHKVDISREERQALVKYLADAYGLAPSETEGFRYILEREPAVVESPASEDLGVLCARCHSYARVALQRRDAEEWRKHAHFHLGQYPTAEYQALGRDRNWWDIVSTQVPEQLAELYPFESEAWNDWKDRPRPDLSGRWRALGNHVGRGRFEGYAEIKQMAADRYDVALTLRYADGETAEGSGAAILYTGYEWRAALSLDKQGIRQVLQLGGEGTEMSGRWFLADQDALGGRLSLHRNPTPRILAVEPPYLQAGTGAEVTVIGSGLRGAPDLGAGVEVEEVVSASEDRLVLRVAAAADAAPGGREVKVGESAAEDLFAVYGKIDRVSVEPPYNIARVGGGGGALPPVPAQFEAVAWLNGPDGRPETEDDLRLGAMPASWSVDNFDAVAAAMEDSKFAGRMDPESGLFLPAEAGPNPARPYQTNNAGNLAVTAVVETGGQKIEGKGQLLVTVQRWNDPPIH